MSSSRGLVLIITLVLLAAISTMASYLYFRAAEDRKLAHVLEKRLEEREFLPLVFEKVLQAAFLYQEKHGHLPPEIAISFEAGNLLGRGEVKLSFAEEAQRFDLRKKDEEKLGEFLSRAGLEEEAPSLRDALLDWQDRDQEPRPLGAEAEDYKSYSPSNKPLTDLYELLLVKGFDPYLVWLQLFPKATVYATNSQKGDETEETEASEKKFSLQAGRVYRVQLEYELQGLTSRWEVIFLTDFERPRFLFAERL